MTSHLEELPYQPFNSGAITCILILEFEGCSSRYASDKTLDNTGTYPTLASQFSPDTRYLDHAMFYTTLGINSKRILLQPIDVTVKRSVNLASFLDVKLRKRNRNNK